MTDKTLKLSATARAMLTQAALREDRLVPPPKLPAAAARQVVRSLISNGLVEEVGATADEPDLVWRTGGDDMPLILRATDAGITAVAEGVDTAPDDWSSRIEPASPDLIALVERIEANKSTGDTGIHPVEPGWRRMGLPQAAEAVVVAWQALGGQSVPDALQGPIQALQAALRPATARPVRPIGQPREGTKQMRVLAMLRRPEGVTVTQIADAMAWQPHTVRGFFVGVRKRLGLTVSGEKVPGTEPGGKAQTVYRIVEAG